MCIYATTYHILSLSPTQVDVCKLRRRCEGWHVLSFVSCRLCLQPMATPRTEISSHLSVWFAVSVYEYMSQETCMVDIIMG